MEHIHRLAGGLRQTALQFCGGKDDSCLIVCNGDPDSHGSSSLSRDSQRGVMVLSLQQVSIPQTTEAPWTWFPAVQAQRADRQSVPAGGHRHPISVIMWH